MLLSEIVCSKIQNKLPQADSCNKYTTKISRNLIYTASKMIFANKYQCILEPIVNSIDAYNSLSDNNSNVGIFGLGFFSLFSLLLDNHKNKMYLLSHNKSGSWEAIIEQKGANCKDVDFNITVNDIEPDFLGLTIEIDLYDDINIEKFTNEVNKLKFISSASIYVNTYKINKVESNNEIIVKITNNFISIEDYAIGISKDTLFNSLLVPSISTKGIKTNIFYEPKIGKLSNIINNNSKISNFYILVNEIIVYSSSTKDKSIDDENYDIIIQLNKNTPIPASRDDINIDDLNVQNELFLNIRYLFTKCMDDNSSYLTFKKFIRKYTDKHPFLSQQMEIIINNTINRYLDNNYYLVPSQYLNLYKCITIKCVPDDGVLHPLVEKKLLSKFKFDKNIISGKNVFIFNDDDLPSSEYAYSSSILFLRNNFINKNNWKEQLLILFPQLSLNDEIFIPSYINIKLRESYINNQRKLLGLRTWYEIYSLNFSYEKANKLLFPNIDDLEFFENYLYLYDLIFDQLRPLSYSHGKHGKIVIHVGDDIFNNKVVENDLFYNNIKVKDYDDINNILIPNIKNISKYKNILSMYLDILRDHINFILNEKISFIPSDILIKIYFTLPYTAYDYIENKYELVFLSIIYLLLNIGKDFGTLMFFQNLWNTLLGTKNNYDTIIQFITFREYSKDAFNLNILNPAEKAYNIYLNSSKIDNSFNYDFNNYNIEFTIKKLYNYIYNNKEFDFFNIDNYLNVEESNIINNLQILDILINDTLIDYVHNLLTVLSKNSLYNIDINVVKNEDDVIITCINKGQLNEDDLISLFLPYYSLDNKYYLIYKQAIYVKFETVCDNILFSWLDEPIINNNRIVDINRKLFISDENNKPTVFQIKFKSTVEDYIRLISFIQDEFSVFKNITLNYNDLEQDNKMVMQNEFGSGYLIPFTRKSLILIDNYIVDDLLTFKIKTGIDIKPYYPTGIFFRFNENLFELMQGDKYVPKVNKKLILNSINELGLYSLFLKQLQDETRTNIVQYYYSYSDTKQVLPSIVGNSDLSRGKFILYYKNNGLNLAEVINMLYDNRLIIDYSHYLAIQVANKWLSYKDNEIKVKSNITIRKKKVNNKLKVFCEKFISTFWEIGKELRYYSKYFDIDAPKLKIDDLEDELLGFYKQYTNLITINSTMFKDYYLTDENMMDYILNYGSNLYGKIYPSSTVIHELSHAWRKNNEGIHDDISLYSVLTKKEEDLNFEEAANYMYDQIIENGFFDRLRLNMDY